MNKNINILLDLLSTPEFRQLFTNSECKFK